MDPSEPSNTKPTTNIKYFRLFSSIKQSRTAYRINKEQENQLNPNREVKKGNLNGVQADKLF